MVQRHQLNSPAKILAAIAASHDKDIDLGLSRIKALLAKLGNPQDRLAPVIHVAGTNGKGSTIAFLRSFFETAGLLVHCYTSPHLLRENECITVAGKTISDDLFCELLNEIIEINQDAPLTAFEAQTVTAFLAFARNRADVVLLETGLGGETDATNVVAKPVLTVLTPISYDHQEFLGNSLTDIATVKAGIMRPGVPCVSGPQIREVMQVLRAKARALKAPLYRYGEAWSVKRIGQRFIHEGITRDTAWPLPALKGAHQLVNAACALSCVEVLKERFHLSDEVLSIGLDRAHWPARLHNVTAQFDLAEGWEVWLDGGHNRDAAFAIKEHYLSWKDKPTHLIVSMLKTKDSLGFLQEVGPGATSISTLQITNQKNSRSAEDLVQCAEKLGLTAHARPTYGQAIDKVVEQGPPGRILICGSLYGIGEAVRELGLNLDV